MKDYKPRKRVIPILLPLDLGHGKNSLKRFRHADHTDEFHQRLSQPSHQCLALGRGTEFRFGHEVEVKLLGEFGMDAACDGGDLQAVFMRLGRGFLLRKGREYTWKSLFFWFMVRIGTHHMDN